MSRLAVRITGGTFFLFQTFFLNIFLSLKTFLRLYNDLQEREIINEISLVCSLLLLDSDGERMETFEAFYSGKKSPKAENTN